MHTSYPIHMQISINNLPTVFNYSICGKFYSTISCILPLHSNLRGSHEYCFVYLELVHFVYTMPRYNNKVGTVPLLEIGTDLYKFYFVMISKEQSSCKHIYTHAFHNHSRLTAQTYSHSLQLYVLF